MNYPYATSASWSYPYPLAQTSPMTPTSFSPVAPKVQTPSPTQVYTLDSLLDSAPGEKPPYKDRILIQYALQGSKYWTLSAKEICEAIATRFAYYRSPDKYEKLKNLVRQRLSYYPQFVWSKKPVDQRGRGDLWTYDPSLEKSSPGEDATEDADEPKGMASNGGGSYRDHPVVSGGQPLHQGDLGFNAPYVQQQYPNASASYPAGYPPHYQVPPQQVTPAMLQNQAYGNPPNPALYQQAGVPVQYIDPRVLMNQNPQAYPGYRAFPGTDARYPPSNSRNGNERY